MKKPPISCRLAVFGVDDIAKGERTCEQASNK